MKRYNKFIGGKNASISFILSELRKVNGGSERKYLYWELQDRFNKLKWYFLEMIFIFIILISSEWTEGSERYFQYLELFEMIFIFL